VLESKKEDYRTIHTDLELLKGLNQETLLSGPLHYGEGLAFILMYSGFNW
jgi:hypothetical protein